ncbi:hypothetical protein BSNK01_26630 [Bacillaceae bacterium]
MENQILEEIERLRRKLVLLATHLGFQNPEVLKLSTRIDKLHNQLNELRYQSPPSTSRQTKAFESRLFYAI